MGIPAARPSRTVPRLLKIPSMVVRHSEAGAGWRCILVEAQCDRVRLKRDHVSLMIVDQFHVGRQGKASGPACQLFPQMVSRSLVQEIVWMNPGSSVSRVDRHGILHFNSEPHDQ